MNCKEINVDRKNFIEIPYGAREGSPESGGCNQAGSAAGCRMIRHRAPSMYADTFIYKGGLLK